MQEIVSIRDANQRPSQYLERVEQQGPTIKAAAQTDDRAK